MKKLLFLLVAVLCLQACSNDSEDWTADSLEMTVSGNFDNNGKVFSGGDGNWGVNVKQEFGGDLKVEVKANTKWTVSVKYITIDQEGWIVPAALEGDGNTSVAITINENKSILYRKAIITLRTTGNIPAEKTITIIQTDAEPVIEFNPLDGEDAEYDSDTKTLTVGYVGNSHRIGFWSNIDNYRMIIKPMNQGDDISWVKGFKVSEEDGIVSFTTSHNFTGAERTVIIRMDAEGFEGADYYLTQKVSLYKNILKTVDGADYNDAQPQPSYSIKNKAITLIYESDETLEVEVIDKATSQPATWARATMAGTTASLSIDINSEVNEREAIVRVKSTNTSYSEQPPVEWTFKQNFEILNATVNHKVDDDQLVFGPTARTSADITVGTYETADEDIKIESSESWAELKLENGLIKLTKLDAFSGSGTRPTTITLTNLNGAMTKSITLTQYADKEIIAKTEWKAELANTHTVQWAGKELNKMFDGKWRMDASDTDSFWESSGSESSPDYEFIFDLNSKQQFNSIGMMPRQQWPKPIPKEYRIAVSNDKILWTDLGKFSGFTSAEVDDDQRYKKQIKWCDFPTVKYQYIKFSLGETYWTNTCCIEEIFVELQ